jgi:hypothetical protein
MIFPAGKKIMVARFGRRRGEQVSAWFFEAGWVELAFRVSMAVGFAAAAWRWGDWRRWRDYYPTALFAMTANLFASYVSYHHDLWIFTPDALVKSHTVVELVSTFVVMPATAFMYLGRFPAAGPGSQAAYTLAWAALYAALEAADTALGGIRYANGWSLGWSVAFDFVMFPIFALHHRRPLLGWLAAAAVAAFVVVRFGFLTAEMK